MTPADLQERALRILVRELGYANAMRFMLQFRGGEGDYTKERRKLLTGLDENELLAAAHARLRPESPPAAVPLDT
ncbi:MAG: hypothetical protein K2Q20_14450 [Phycisphaerales bacterium]|nr:hypothetical protein [Phycisphaerales bacterium]